MALKSFCIPIILLLFSASLVLGSIEDSYALKAQGSKGLSPKSFGAATNNIVCGIQLCSEITSKPIIKDFLQNNVKLILSDNSILLSNNDLLELSADKITNIIDGKTLEMFGYNGVTPGPLLQVKQGDEVSVNFINNLDFPTTVHWHGLRLDYTSDGVPGITQDPIMPGESFDYRLKFPDSGIFLYHPHVRTEMQMEMGLYGNILVESKSKSDLPVNVQVPIILDDISIIDDKLQTFDPEIVTHTLMGRFGNTMLINGDTNYSVQIDKGEIARFYLTNTANTRTFDFSIEQHKLKLISDDASNYEKEEFVNSAIIAPSERRTVDVLFNKVGEYKIIHKTPETKYVLGKIIVRDSSYRSDPDFYTIKQNMDIINEINSFKKFFSERPDLEIEFDVKTKSMEESMEHNSMEMKNSMESNSMSMDLHEVELEPIEWEDEMPKINAMSDEKNTKWILRDTKTGKEGFDINYQANVGDVKKFRFINDPDSAHPMQHPIHLHGQRFLLLSEDGIPNDNLAWKDSVLVPAGKTVDILVEFSNPGNWAMHCHILEHAEAGMITEVIVN